MRLPSQQRRLIALGYGLALFVWLQVEDNSPLPVALFGGGLAILLTLDRLSRRVPARWRLAGAALLGGIAGVGSTLATVALMLLKTGLHSHLFPDYPPGQMLAMLERAPTWGLAGALAGLGMVLAAKGMSDERA